MILENLQGEKVRRMNDQHKNDKTERARGLGKSKTREEIGKGNEMTALRFHSKQEGICRPVLPSQGSK